MSAYYYLHARIIPPEIVTKNDRKPHAIKVILGRLIANITGNGRSGYEDVGLTPCLPSHLNSLRHASNQINSHPSLYLNFTALIK